MSLVTIGLVSLHHRLDTPYCLSAAGIDDVAVDDHDEWIGTRTCLGWSELGRNARNTLVGRIADRLSVHEPGPEDNQGLFDVNLIYRENKRIERLSADSGRGVVTVAMVTSLTTSTPTRPIRSVVAEREGLAGGYAAQVRINADRNQRMPYLRLAIVNSGDLTPGVDAKVMDQHLGRMRDSLRRLARSQRLIAAVVTLNSSTQVQGALRDSLGADGIAMISPTMSADRFGDEVRPPAADGDVRRPVFFPVNPANDDQVELIAQYARRSGAPARRRLVYYYPVDPAQATPGFDPTDLYLSTLFCDVWDRAGYRDEALRGGAEALHASTARARCEGASRKRPMKGLDVELWPWSRERPADELRASACPESTGSPGRSPLLFFGGRYSDVAAFTQLVQVGCGSARPEVAVADSATRFLADGELAGLVPHRTRVLIASRGPALTCATLPEQDEAAELQPYDRGRRDDFADDIRNVLHRCRNAGDPEADRRLAGSWAVLGYDTVLMIRDVMLRIGLNNLREPRRPRAAATAPAGSDHVPGLRGATELRGLVLRCLQGPPPPARATARTAAPAPQPGDTAATPCVSRVFPGAYGSIRVEDGIGRRTVTLLDVPDLATAFASASINPKHRCVPPEKPPAERRAARCVFR
jgi:hypothetical protein